MRRLRSWGRETGQATVEVLSMLPLLVAAALLVWQMLLVGVVLTSASNAARTGSRVASQDGDGQGAANAALRSSFRPGSTITVNGTSVKVSVPVPIIVPWVHLPLNVSSTATIPRTT